MQNLSLLLTRLANFQVDFVLVGGYAAVFHGATQVTSDIDICMAFTPANLARFQQAMSDLHPVHRMTPQKLPFTLTPELIAVLKNLYLQTDLGQLDCLGEVMGVGNFEVVKRHSLEFESSSGKWRVLDLPTLIQAKRAMGRPHDKITALQLQAILESQE